MSNELPYCSAQFQWDFEGTGPLNTGKANPHSLEADAAQFSDDLTLEAQAKKAVVAECEALVGKYKGHPEELLVVLIVKVLGTRSDKAYELELKTTADGVQVQTDITNLTNDIQNPINKGAAGPKGIIEVAAETDEMQNVLGKSSASASVAKMAKEVQDALGSSASTLMSENFGKMRGDIFWAEDPEASTYNPTQQPAPSDTSDYTYHLDPDSSGADDKGYIHSFAEMQADLKLQGNPKGAQEANKIMLDNYNQNVSTTQSLGTAANAEVGLVTSRIKMNTSAVSDFAQDLLTGSRTAVKNQIPQ